MTPPLHKITIHIVRKVFTILRHEKNIKFLIIRMNTSRMFLAEQGWQAINDRKRKSHVYTICAHLTRFRPGEHSLQVMY